MYKRISHDRLYISCLLVIRRQNTSIMKLFVVAVLALLAVVNAAPQESSQIIRSNFDQQPEGSYKYGFETDNGIVRNEDGELKQILDEENKPHDVIVIRGSYTYRDPEGKEVTINYYADETGFHAEGDSIPKQARR